ncbi:NACHT domain-containing protein [Streptomyces noursei]|uniref:NACHT domain-containing protein n=1 Tax=Streptomyces noursei TaxID=1971 RepID=UPI0030F32127
MSGEVHNEFSGNAESVVQAGEIHVHHSDAPPDAVERLAQRLARAVAGQWKAEAAVRGLFGAAPLPIAWEMAGGQGVWSAARFADLYRQLPTPRRLVILGSAGAGKTTMAVLLVHELLAHRAVGDPIPVLLSIGSWDPTAEHLTNWLPRRLAEEYPVLGTGATAAANAGRLLDAGLVLPVLDGLDELPQRRRADALAKINQALSDHDPLVLTCRTDEYQALLNGSDGLYSATVLRARPVAPEDVRRYLLAPHSARREARWRPVLDRLAAEPRGPLADALASPLLLSLARTAYAPESGHDPAELVDTARLSSAAAIEAHLLDALLSTAFRSEPAARNAFAWRARRWDEAKSRRWLVFLAQHMKRLKTRDLAWWQLEQDGPASENAWTFGAAAWGCFSLAIIVAAVVGGRAVPWGFVWSGGGPIGAMCCIALWRGGAVRKRPLYRSRYSSVAVGGSLATATMFVVAWVATGGRVPVVPTALACVVALGLLVPNAMMSIYWDRKQVDVESVSPAVLMARERRAPLTVAAVSAILVLVGTDVVHEVTGLSRVHDDVPLSFRIAQCVMAFALWAIIASRWGAYQVTHARLALRGKLPWRLMRFLDDAHQRGVMRQEGSVYQFRHARLQERLVAGGRNPEGPGR